MVFLKFIFKIYEPTIFLPIIFKLISKMIKVPGIKRGLKYVMNK